LSAGALRKVAILGATGRTGRILVARAREFGMGVNALARDPASLKSQNPDVNVVEGSSTDKAAVERVVGGCDAVLSALGRVKGSPTDLLTASAANMISAMKKSGLKRMVVLTDTSVRDPSDAFSITHGVLRWVLPRVNGPLVRDSGTAAALIADSGLSWTLVRAPILTDGPKSAGYRTGALTNAIPLRVSRASVADFMLACVIEGKYMNERTAIGG
jgi:uncharacterized protein YbjT (DUF2867 family)